MRKTLLKALLVFLLLLLPLVAFARDVAPIVSTDWLEQNLSNQRLVIVDIRKVEEYKAGHIPGAVNVFYGTWAITKGGLQNQLPEDAELGETLGSAGIRPNSIVVVVGKTDAPPDRVNVTRVAWTFLYTGVQNVAVLDGGYNKWAAEKKTLSTETARPRAAAYRGKFNRNVLASKDYVTEHMGKAVIVDVREPDFYTGKKKLDFVARAGHIPGAVNLPTQQVYAKDWTYKSKDELAAMAAPVVGTDKSREIIVYCDTGRVSTTWYYLLSEVLGYKNVKSYDGSMEEWAKDPKAPMEM